MDTLCQNISTFTLNGDVENHEEDTLDFKCKKLFLGGLRYTESEESVARHFERFGTIDSVLIPKDKTTGKPRGFGFVTFKENGVAYQLAKDAKRSPHEFNGRHLDIKVAFPKPNRDVDNLQSQDDDHDHFNERLSEDELKFKPFRTTIVAKDSESNEDDEKEFEPDVEKPTGEMGKSDSNGQDIPVEKSNFDVNLVIDTAVEEDGKPRMSRKGSSNSSSTLPTRIFVGGLPEGVTNTTMKEYFSRFGTVLDSFVLLHPQTKRPRGFGFVSFKDKDVVSQVLAYPMHQILGKRVETRPANIRNPPEKSPKSADQVGLMHPSQSMNGNLNFTPNSNNFSAGFGYYPQNLPTFGALNRSYSNDSLGMNVAGVGQFQALHGVQLPSFNSVSSPYFQYNPYSATAMQFYGQNLSPSQHHVNSFSEPQSYKNANTAA